MLDQMAVDEDNMVNACAAFLSCASWLMITLIKSRRKTKRSLTQKNRPFVFLCFNFYNKEGKFIYVWKFKAKRIV